MSHCVNMPFSEEEMRILQLPFDDPTFELWAGQYVDAFTLLFCKLS